MAIVKLTAEQANELFTQLGVAVAVVGEGEEATPEVDFDGLVSEIRPEARAQEGEVVDKDKLTSAAMGRQMGIIYSTAARAFGLKRSDIDGLPPEELMAKIKSMSEGRYTQTEAQLRQELEEAINNHNAETERLRIEHEAALSTERERFTERDIVAHFRKEYESIPKKGGDLDLLAETGLERARRKYDVKWNADKGRVEYFEKGNPEKRVLIGKNELDTKAFLSDFNKALGNEATDTRHIAPADVQKEINVQKGIVPMSGGEPNTGVSPNIARLAQQAEEIIASA